MGMDSGPLVSVIMPAYNHARFVEDAVRSVWSQTYPYVELIVLDDGSADETPAILERLRAASPIPMRVVSKPNEGVTRTLNRGLAMARGSFIALSSGDDRYLPEHVATLVAAAGAEPAGTVVYGDVYMIDDSGARTGRKLSDDYPFRSGMVFEPILLSEFVLPGLAALFPAAALREGGGYNEKSLIDDWEMFLRITRTAPVRYLGIPLAEYRVHEGQSTLNVGRLVPEMVRIFEENLRVAPRGADRRWARYARSRLYRRIGRSFYIVRDFAQARRWMLRSQAEWPLQVEPLAFVARSLLGVRVVERLSAIRSAGRRGKAPAAEAP